MLVPPGKRLCARRFAWGSVFVKCFSSRCGAAGFGVLCASYLEGTGVTCGCEGLEEGHRLMGR